MELSPLDPTHAADAAAVLYAAFREPYPHAWPTIAAARDEVDEALSPERIAIGAFSDRLVGWIGAIPQYVIGGHCTGWELHPLAVVPELQRSGIGRALVRALETELANRRATMVYLGTDDESGITVAARHADDSDAPRDFGSLVGLMNDPSIDADVPHPYVFYRRNGYRVCGIVPDANGRDRPDIIMYKTIGGRR